MEYCTNFLFIVPSMFSIHHLPFFNFNFESWILKFRILIHISIFSTEEEKGRNLRNEKEFIDISKSFRCTIALYQRAPLLLRNKMLFDFEHRVTLYCDFNTGRSNTVSNKRFRDINRAWVDSIMEKLIAIPLVLYR